MRAGFCPIIWTDVLITFYIHTRHTLDNNTIKTEHWHHWKWSHYSLLGRTITVTVLFIPLLQLNEMSSSKFHKMYLNKRFVNNNNSIQQMSPDMLIYIDFGFGGVCFFQVIRKAKTFCAFAAKLTKHYIATWPSVRIKLLLYSMMLLWFFYFFSPKLVIHMHFFQWF